METELRSTGIDVIGDVPWGTALCHFYDTTQDLADVALPFLAAGLAAGECCVWLVTAPFHTSVAWGALTPLVDDLPRRRERGDIEVRDAREWYRLRGGFAANRLGEIWSRRLSEALSNGLAGLRVVHENSWLEGADRHAFCWYENPVDEPADRRMVALSTYALDQCRVTDLLDVMRKRQFAITHWRGARDVLECRHNHVDAVPSKATSSEAADNPFLDTSAAVGAADGTSPRGPRANGKHHFPEIVGESVAIQQVLAEVRRIAPTDAPVFIAGEPGSGKELLARAIHAASSRCAREMVNVNCASVPAEQLESELFGHARGTFPNGGRDGAGRFEMADRSTIFLDEVCEIAPALQGKLLRLLQEGRFQRVGEDRTRQANVRVIAASSRDVRQEVESGRFRLDLYYRLCVFPINLPPLRARSEDVIPLARHFFRDISRRMRRSDLRLDESDLASFKDYPWPGNVRELHHVIERAVVLCPPGSLRVGPYMLEANSIGSPARSFDRSGRGATVMSETEIKSRERKNIVSALEQTGWRIYGTGGAAALLGLKPTTLASRLKRLGIERPRGTARQI